MAGGRACGCVAGISSTSQKSLRLSVPCTRREKTATLSVPCTTRREERKQHHDVWAGTHGGLQHDRTPTTPRKIRWHRFTLWVRCSTTTTTSIKVCARGHTFFSMSSSWKRFVSTCAGNPFCSVFGLGRAGQAREMMPCSDITFPGNNRFRCDSGRPPHTECMNTVFFSGNPHTPFLTRRIVCDAETVFSTCRHRKQQIFGNKESASGG